MPASNTTGILDSVELVLRGVYALIGQFFLTIVGVSCWPKRMWHETHELGTCSEPSTRRYLPALLFFWIAMVLFFLSMATMMAAAQASGNELSQFLPVESVPNLVLEAKITKLILLLLPWIGLLGLYGAILAGVSSCLGAPITFSDALDCAGWCAGCAVIAFVLATPVAVSSILSGGHGLVFTYSGVKNYSDWIFGISLQIGWLWLLLFSHVRLVSLAGCCPWKRALGIIAATIIATWVAASAILWAIAPLFRAWMLYLADSGSGE